MRADARLIVPVRTTTTVLRVVDAHLRRIPVQEDGHAVAPADALPDLIALLVRKELTETQRDLWDQAVERAMGDDPMDLEIAETILVGLVDRAETKLRHRAIAREIKVNAKLAWEES